MRLRLELLLSKVRTSAIHEGSQEKLELFEEAVMDLPAIVDLETEEESMPIEVAAISK